MVSNASEDLPDPDRPVTTVSVLRGIETEMLRRLCCRAPRTVMCVIAMQFVGPSHIHTANAEWKDQASRIRHRAPFGLAEYDGENDFAVFLTRSLYCPGQTFVPRITSPYTERISVEVKIEQRILFRETGTNALVPAKSVTNIAEAYPILQQASKKVAL